MSRHKPAPLLSDIARLAGVSLATASRSLSEPDLVLPKTRRRVQWAVEKLGYVPHGAARALASKRTKTVGAVIPTLNNPIFASSVQAMQSRLASDGFTLLLGSHEYDLAAEIRVVAALIERGVYGIVLVGMDHDPGVYRLLDQAGVPYELTWTLEIAGNHHCLGFSNRAAAARVVVHLLDLGHRNFAIVSGHTRNNDRARERAEGVREELRVRTIDIPSLLVIETEFSLQHGRQALANLLATNLPLTAVICGNDILALGVLIEAATRGIAVPGRLSVTGFDDIDMAREFRPSLTTMRLPVVEIGQRAAERILARIDGQEVARVEEVRVELVQRESSGRATSRGQPVHAPS